MHVTVTVDGQVNSDSNEAFSYMAPVVISATSVPQSGGLVTIIGNDFGLDSSVISVSIGTQTCTNVVVVNTTSITCDLASGTGSDLHVTANVNGQSNTDNNSAFSYSSETLGSTVSTATSATATIGTSSTTGSAVLNASAPSKVPVVGTLLAVTMVIIFL